MTLWRLHPSGERVDLKMLTHREVIERLKTEGIYESDLHMMVGVMGRFEHRLFYEDYTERDPETGMWRLARWVLEQDIRDEFPNGQLDWHLSTRIEL